MRRKGLREIEWGLPGGDRNKTVIYDNGHEDPEAFLRRVVADKTLDTPLDVRQALTAADVEHMRFRAMSPTEAKSWDCDSGVLECESETRGYPVTAEKS